MSVISSLNRLLTPVPQTMLVAAVATLSILFVTVLASRVAVLMHQGPETRLVERIGEVYLDGLSAVVEPNAEVGHEKELMAALERIATYHDGVREVRIVVRSPSGQILGDLARDETAAKAELPRLDTEIPLTESSDRNRFWVQRPLWRGDRDRARAVLSAQLDLKPIRDERLAADIKSLAVNAIMALTLAAFGYWLMRRLLGPLRLLETALDRAAAGDPQPIGAAAEVPANPRLASLIRAYDTMAQAQVERAQLRIAQAERLRAADLGRLAATVAHEVRNPLAGMLNAIDTARRFPDNRAAVAGSLDLVERGLAAISRVVDTTLSLHRPPPGGKPVDAVDFEDLARLIRPAAARRGVRLDWRARIEEALPLDAAVVRQIVLNLGLNAIAAARPNGRVEVRAEVDAEGLIFSIVDDGVGLEPAVMRRLETLDLDWIDTSEGGIGLGVVMRAVASLGGRIVPGRRETPPATTIGVHLPFATASREDPQDAEERS
ncbi:MAG: HAMP domain-containing histidine kinase [Hyphomicrobiales bacterium]|nr:HAMP domain-containing histidine kinase [Hyphomicrobiales bacterium]